MNLTQLNFRLFPLMKPPSVNIKFKISKPVPLNNIWKLVYLNYKCCAMLLYHWLYEISPEVHRDGGQWEIVVVTVYRLTLFDIGR